MSLVAWPASDANSFGSLADADEYFADQVRGPTWLTFTAVQRSAGLVTGTRLLNRQHWTGARTDPEQPLAFPRVGVTSCDGTAIADDVIPIEILHGLYELALEILLNEGAETNPSADRDVRRIKAEGAEIEFFQQRVVGRFPAVVMEAIRCLLGGGEVVGLKSGEYESEYCEVNRWEPFGPT